ncbi:hypothetical protein CG709_13325, partial [Lachnotalea glycerini]
MSFCFTVRVFKLVWLWYSNKIVYEFINICIQNIIKSAILDTNERESTNQPQRHNTEPTRQAENPQAAPGKKKKQ